jgi:hypothetical protein
MKEDPIPELKGEFLVNKPILLKPAVVRRFDNTACFHYFLKHRASFADLMTGCYRP